MENRIEGKPPRMPGAGGDSARAHDKPSSAATQAIALDSPVSGLMHVSPFGGNSQCAANDRSETGSSGEDRDNGGLVPEKSSGSALKSALSTTASGGLKRNVSWADFNDAAALTTVVEFERDPMPSSPTSVGSWDSDQQDSGCICCSIM